MGDITSPPRTHHHIPGSDAARMLLMPAWRDRGSIGVKVLTLDPARTLHGAPSLDGLYLLLDGATGAPQVIMDAGALTAIRTAAVSALAASLLARDDASTLLMVGPGRLSKFILEAHCAVRDYKRVLIWGRDPRKAEAVRASVKTDAKVVVVDDLSQAASSADVISCATSSVSPLLFRRDVRPGTHVDLIGSYTSKMQEAEAALFEGARVFVDTKDALTESGDLVQPCAMGLLHAEAVRDLAELLRDPSIGRASAQEITIFKAAGSAISDLGAAEYLLKAQAQSPMLK